MSSFKYWTAQQVEDTFHIQRMTDCPLLRDWLAMSCSPTEEEKIRLDGLKQKLEVYADTWNEEELKLKFIAQMLELAQYEKETYNAFANRKLSFKHGDKLISGAVDLMIASGRYEPKQPYFCFHEYKKERGNDSDPRGQLLIAMVAAQHIQQNEKPIYGCYVNGRMWFFSVLYQKSYCFSHAFIASEEDIFPIFAALRSLNTIISQNLLP